MNSVRGSARPRAPDDGDTQPWYRQFWPWFLIVLPGSVVIAGISTVVIALRHADDLVVDDYYKSGLAINQRLEKQREATSRGLAAELTVMDRRLQLRTRGAVGPGALRLQLSHPLEAELDFAVQLEATAPGLYVTTLPRAPQPNWHWALDAGDGSDWRLTGSLSAADFVGADLPPMENTGLSMPRDPDAP